MDRGRKVGRFMSLPFLKPSSDLPVTCLPPIYLPWTWTLDPSGASAPSVEILGSFQHLPAIGLFQGQDVHWMKLRPAYVRTCHQLLGWTWMNKHVAFDFLLWPTNKYNLQHIYIYNYI
jgi:hypothetical protein